MCIHVIANNTFSIVFCLNKFEMKHFNPKSVILNATSGFRHHNIIMYSIKKYIWH